ncbi:MAG: AMP-dependent synthetase, partial [Chloroflexi bacterium]|nr:AMP-dependent synthetase [Chloroflexota bacterium]
DVAEAAVVGVPHDLLGEVPHAFVVPRPGSSTDEAAILRWCRENLAGPRAPVAITLVERLPRTASGKLLRAELRESLRRG